MRRGARYTGWEAGGGGRPRCRQRAGEGLTTQIGGRARGGAHVEHLAHGGDAGGVEGERLVERRRALPRVRRGVHARGAGRGIRVGRRKAADDGGARVERRALMAGTGAGGAHQEHVAHGFDAWRVEVQRLVERQRKLPSRREVCDMGRGVGREAGGRRTTFRRPQAACVCGMRHATACGMRHARGRDVGGQRGRAKRTTNIPCMVVTLDVLKLSGWLNTDACTAEQKGKHAMFGARCGPGGGRA